MYPKDFFDQVTGAPPKSDEVAATYWSYRKARPTFGISDPEEPNGEAMRIEMEDIHQSLLVHTKNKVHKTLLDTCRDVGLKCTTDNQKVTTLNDLRKTLDHIEENEENIQKLHKILFESTSGRQWVADVVDEWLKANNMTLPGADCCDEKLSFRKSAHNRGSFGIACRRKKNDMISNLTKRMQNSNSWSICTNKPKNSSVQEVKIKTDGKQKKSVHVLHHTTKTWDAKKRVSCFMAAMILLILILTHFFWPVFTPASSEKSSWRIGVNGEKKGELFDGHMILLILILTHFFWPVVTPASSEKGSSWRIVVN